jgi:regulator of ribonuclease activity A
LFEELPAMLITSTCDLCDAHKNTSDDRFRVLPPVFQHFGARLRFSGPVRTVKCFEDNSLVKAALDSPGVVDTEKGQQGCVLVVDGGASLRRALVGGNLAAAAVKNGWVGIVVNGCVRDVTELNQADVGVRALGLHPMPTAKRGEGESDVAVQIQGVWVRPGDWLVADEDGVVLVATA